MNRPRLSRARARNRRTGDLEMHVTGTASRRLGPVVRPGPLVEPPAPFPQEALHPVEDHLARYLRRRWSVRDGDTVVVGWSGGQGSSALVAALVACAEGIGPRVRILPVHVAAADPSPEDRRRLEQSRLFFQRIGVPLRVVEAPVSGSASANGDGGSRSSRVLAALCRVAAEEEAAVSLLGRTRDERVLEILHRVLEEGVLDGIDDHAGPAMEGGDSSRPVASPFVEIEAGPVRRYAAERAPEFRFSTRAPAEDPRHPRAALRRRLLPEIFAEYPHAETCILRLEQIAQQAARALARGRLAHSG